jgi:hypothetical protein
MRAISTEKGLRVCQDMCASAAELERLTPLYQDTRAMRSIALRRNKIILDFNRASDEFNLLYGEFKRCEKSLQTRLAFKALRFKTQAKPPESKQGAKADLVQYYVYDDAWSDVKHCAAECRKKVQAADALFNAATALHEQRLARRRNIAIIAAALLLCAAFPILLARLTAARTVRQALLAPPQAAAASKDEIGRVLAENIRLDRLIGRGGMGVVYEGTDLTLDRKVAVKRMRDEVSEDPRGLKQFLAEARLVATLKHPNIVDIYSILKEQDRLYLVFEYVEGNTLDSALVLNKTITLEQSLSVLRQAASALDYAHSKKVIHRDLKPSNIMLTKAGVARLMDFGIAYQAKKTIAMLTKAERWGTPAFMSPEQELGEIGRETDIYALGVCFYAMLTGTLPFQGPDFLGQKRALNMTGAERLPEKLLPVVKKAFAVDPGRRYRSGAEMLSAIEALPF